MNVHLAIKVLKVSEYKKHIEEIEKTKIVQYISIVHSFFIMIHILYYNQSSLKT